MAATTNTPWSEVTSTPFAQARAFGNNRPGQRSLYTGGFGFTLGTSSLDARPVCKVRGGVGHDHESRGPDAACGLQPQPARRDPGDHEAHLGLDAARSPGV